MKTQIERDYELLLRNQKDMVISEEVKSKDTIEKAFDDLGDTDFFEKAKKKKSKKKSKKK